MKTKSNTAKLLYIVFIALMGVVIFSSIIFMNEYRWVQIYGEVNKATNSVTINRSSTGYDPNNSNIYVFDFFTKLPGVFSEYPSKNFSDYAMNVYNFQNSLNDLNNLILTFGLVGLICVCVMLILANQSRVVYYITNLISGTVCPLVIAVFGIVVLAKNLEIMGQYQNDSILYNVVAALQSPDSFRASQVTTREAIEAYFTCTPTTFYVYSLIYIIVIGYSIFMIVYTIIRFNGSAERRKEILSRVVKNDD